jgi:hypothetical protein
MRKMLLMTVALALVCMTGTVLAVDYWGGPPDGTWDRGEPGTTFEHWDFSDPAWFLPEMWDNPYGEPWADFDPPTGWEWGVWEAPQELDPTGFVDGWHCSDPAGGSITLVIPNSDDPNGFKYIFLQVTSSKAPTDVTVSGSGSNPGGYGSGSWQTGRPQIQWPGNAPFGGVWYTYNYGRYIIPNPQSETITLTFPFCSVVDQIVVDTICTTDPVATEESSWSRVKVLFR